MKIKGWQRIGITASVVWIIGAGAYSYDRGMKSDIELATATHVACDEAHPDNTEQCSLNAYAYLERAARFERIDATVVALVPVPLAWGAAYFALFLFRWVRKGFNPPSNQF